MSNCGKGDINKRFKKNKIKGYSSKAKEDTERKKKDIVNVTEMIPVDNTATLAGKIDRK